MACDLLDYLDLDDAMKVGDIGRIQDHLLFRFVGGGNKNYAMEILELLQGIHCEWPSDLRYAGLGCYNLLLIEASQGLHSPVLLACKSNGKVGWIPSNRPCTGAQHL
jgi:hypothetical protein